MPRTTSWRATEQGRDQSESGTDEECEGCMREASCTTLMQPEQTGEEKTQTRSKNCSVSLLLCSKYV